MPIFKDNESKQEIFDLIDKFDRSSLFELEITLPMQPQYTKIKMMKLAQHDFDDSIIKVKIDDTNGAEENFELKSKTKGSN